MNKTTFTKTALDQGEMRVYDFGAVKLHAYQTQDPLDDEVFLLEKQGQVVLLESPCFVQNNRALTAYLAERKLSVAGMLLAYHMAGGTFLPEARKYATRNADAYGHQGRGRSLIDGFTAAFGPRFDGTLHTVTDYLEAGVCTIGGISFRILPTPEAFDVEIPELNAVYTHMLGHDCHSIVAGPAHADAMLRQLRGYLDKGYTLVLTSHYTPEDLKDVRTKLEYLENLKRIAALCCDRQAFLEEVRRQYGSYGGDHYLDMTAEFFFPQ